MRRIVSLWILCLCIGNKCFLASVWPERWQHETEPAGCAQKDNTLAVDGYFINLKKSWKRRQIMDYQSINLNLNLSRINGVAPEQIYVKEMANFTFKERYDGQLAPSEDESLFVVDVAHGNFVRMKPGYHDHSNTPKELACYISHLMAIFSAVNSPSCARYALILEDDVYFEYEINFSQLLRLAPSTPWGTLQLFTNNVYVIDEQFRAYLKNTGDLFVERNRRSEWWGRGAIIVDKFFWKRVLDQLIYIGSDGKFHFKIIAAVRRSKRWKCVPYMCCDDRGRFVHKLPCFMSFSGFQADMILFEYMPTYLLRIPVFNLHPEISKKSQIQEQKTSAQMENFTVNVISIVNSILSGFYNGTFKLPAKNVFRKFPSVNYVVNGM